MGLVNRVLARQTIQSDWQESVRFVADGDALQGGIGFTRTGDTYEADGVGVMPAQDGVTPVVGDRFVLDFAAPDIDTGILEVVDVGGAGTYKWKRAAGLDSSIDPSKPAGMTVRVEEGGVFASLVVKITTTGDITINTTALDFDVDSSGGASTLQQAYDGGQIITVDIPGVGTFLVQNTAADGGAVMKLSQLSGAGLGGELLTLEMGAAQTAGIAAFINDLSDYSNPANSAIAMRVRAGSPLQNALRVGTTFEIDAGGTGVQVSLDSQATLLLYSDIAIRIGRTAANGGAYKVPLLAVGEEFTLPAAKGAAGTVMTDVAGDGVLSMQVGGGGGFDIDEVLLTPSDAVTALATFLTEESHAYTIIGALTARTQFGFTKSAHWHFMISAMRQTGTTFVHEFKILHEKREVVGAGIELVDFTLDLTGATITFQVKGENVIPYRWGIRAMVHDSGLAV